jgi:hypothetical protein
MEKLGEDHLDVQELPRGLLNDHEVVLRPLLRWPRVVQNPCLQVSAPGGANELLRDMGYSLQANSKTREGTQHIDRDAQFRYINTQALAFLAANEPVISVDIVHKTRCCYRGE